jgi:hypothetical protein
MVSQFDPAELVAGLAGGIDVLHAITPADLGGKEFGCGLDLLIEELAELLRVVHDPLVFPLRARDADRLVTPRGLRRALGHRHGVLPGDDLLDPQSTRADAQRIWTSGDLHEIRDEQKIPAD